MKSDPRSLFSAFVFGCICGAGVMWYSIKPAVDAALGEPEYKHNRVPTGEDEWDVKPLRGDPLTWLFRDGDRRGRAGAPVIGHVEHEFQG